MKMLPKTSRAAVVTEFRKMEMQEFPMPEVHDDDGILEVEMVGVCGSDPGFYSGKLDLKLPLLMGHEIVGRIAAIGEKKAKRNGVKVGDRVVVQNRFGCGVCRECIQGRYEKCVDRLGYGVFIPCSEPPYLWGGYSEYLYLPPRAMIHKIDENIPLEAAVFTTSVIGNCINWVREIGQLMIGETIVIAGPGQQGLAGTAVAKECGARVIVIGTSKDADRLALAREFGADYTLVADEVDTVEAVREITNGEMANVFMDVTGVSKVLETAIDHVGTFGRIVVPGMYGPHPASIDFDKVIFKQAKFLGAHAQTYFADEAAVRFVEARKYPLEKMVTHKFELEDAEKAVLTTAREIPGENPIKCVIMPHGVK